MFFAWVVLKACIVRLQYDTVSYWNLQKNEKLLRYTSDDEGVAIYGNADGI